VSGLILRNALLRTFIAFLTLTTFNLSSANSSYVRLGLGLELELGLQLGLGLELGLSNIIKSK
jgi:hypothetical protein